MRLKSNGEGLEFLVYNAAGILLSTERNGIFLPSKTMKMKRGSNPRISVFSVTATQMLDVVNIQLRSGKLTYVRPHLPTYFVQKLFWVPCLEWNRWHLAVTGAVEQTGVQTRKAFGSQFLWFPGFQVFFRFWRTFYFSNPKRTGGGLPPRRVWDVYE